MKRLLIPGSTAVVLMIIAAVVWRGIRERPARPSSRPAPSANSRTDGVSGLPTVSGSPFQSRPEQIAPHSDRWPSEVFAERAAGTLDRLKTALERDPLGSSEDFEASFATDFVLTVESDTPPIHFADSQITVRRVASMTTPRTYRDSEAISQFLGALSATPTAAQPSHTSIKLIKVDLRDAGAATVLRAESNWNAPHEAIQKTSHWRCEWQLVDGDPRIATVELESLEIVHRKGPPWFADGTETVLGHSRAFRRQLAHGLQHWLARIETAHGMNYFSKHGVAVADVNGDGRDDVYVSQPGGLPNRLFVQNEKGTATERSAAFGLDFLDRTSSAVFVDLDNDGDQDAALATIMGVLILENVEQQTFRRKQLIRFEDIDLQGLSAVDYDGDGDLDLYQIVDYASQASRSRRGLPAFIYHDARDGGANRLLRNERQSGQPSQWSFRDVTSEVGLDMNNQRHSLAAAWEDYDNDGDQDLYVANDYGPNSLYRNDDGRFVDVADECGVVDFGSGMSVAWGDYNRDGRMDLYVGNMFSSAGNRITTQQQFLPSVSPQRRLVYQRFAKGNSLFLNRGGTFQETGATAGVEMARWAWSSVFSDINNDGWDDLLVANGYITTKDSGDL